MGDTPPPFRNVLPFLRPQSERVPTTAAAMIVISENDATGGGFCFVLFESKRGKLLQARPGHGGSCAGSLPILLSLAAANLHIRSSMWIVK